MGLRRHSQSSCTYIPTNISCSVPTCKSEWVEDSRSWYRAPASSRVSALDSLPGTVPRVFPSRAANPCWTSLAKPRLSSCSVNFAIDSHRLFFKTQNSFNSFYYEIIIDEISNITFWKIVTIFVIYNKVGSGLESLRTISLSLSLLDSIRPSCADVPPFGRRSSPSGQ